MTPDRLRQLEALYHAVREVSAEEREALLGRTDSELRRALESLLTERSQDEILEKPAIRNAPEFGDDAATTLLDPGACLGPYRIVDKLGEGGMGEVFRAVDTRLGRAIAIKTTREQFSARFEREARAISALNHPNICTLHDVGPNYLVMELVEGETLAAMLRRGPMPAETAVLYASQIAAALAEAHSKGVIHRDLKPGNIMIGKSGVKVLDFGLARMGTDVSLTSTHVIVGTPAYMAPEQRMGEEADHRSDIYAFGLVLYEMLTGARMGPQPKRIRPRELERIVQRCLEQDPQKRWQSAAEVQARLSSRSGRSKGYAAAIVMAVAAVSGVAYFAAQQRPRELTEKDKVVVADFDNKAGDPIFEPTLRQGLTSQLEQSPYLTLVPEQQIRQVLRMMNRPPDARLTPEVSREICERTGSTAVLEGSIVGVGSRYVLWVRARNCGTGDVLAEEQAQAESKEKVLDAMSRIAIQTRARLGESLASVREHSKPLPEATTSSLDALKAYSAATVAKYAGMGPVAIRHLRRAIAIDPQFAMAHADLGFVSWDLGQTDLGAEEVRIAYGLRDRVSDREQRYITMLYDRQVTGNLQKELQTLESWSQTYPRDAYAAGITGGWVTFGTGEYERGIQASQRAIQLSPEVPFPYASIAIHSLCLGRFAQSEEALRLAAERKLEIPSFLVARYHLAFLKGDREGMDREIARARGEGVEDWMAHNEALVLARVGRMAQARVLWERAIALALQADKRETAAIYTAAEAVCEAHCMNGARAKKRAEAALQLGKGRDVVYAAAFALARSGDSSGAQRLAAELEKRFPEDTPVQFEYLPTLRALFALGRRALPEAEDRLQKAVPYDYAMPGTLFFGKYGGLYTAYVRGEALLAAGRGQEAAAEFQKVLKSRGLVLADPIGTLAHLQIGRAYAVMGDRAKAKEAYKEFLALWQDADAGIPLLQSARSEFAKL